MSNFPNLELRKDPVNPIVKSQYVPYELSLYQTKYTLMDIDVYTNFLKNAISRFRKSRTYKGYKAYLMNLGLDHCQLNSNISSEMATIEMHHNMLTIFDIAIILCEHTINTVGYITTYDLVNLMKKVHKENKVQLVMLSLTSHQLYHNAQGMFIHPDMCIGNWPAFLEEYNKGITIDIANKVINYINTAISLGDTKTGDLLKLRDSIQDWSIINEYGANNCSWDNSGWTSIT